MVRDADQSAAAREAAASAAPGLSLTPPPPDPPSTKQATPSAAPAIPDVSQLAERWSDLLTGLRAAGKSLAATALEHTSPIAVTAAGEVTIALDEANTIYEQALESSKGELAQLLRGVFSGVQRVTLRAATRAAAPSARLTDEMVRADRLSAIRRRDPVLDRAIDVLDLELAD